MVNDYLLTFKNLEILSLIELSPQTQSDVAKKTNRTFSWSTTLIHEYKYLGLIQMEKNGRDSVLTLTKKGKAFNRLIKEAMDVIDYEPNTHKVLQKSVKVRLQNR